MALLPEEQHLEGLREFTQQLSADQSEGVQEILAELIERKQRFFDGNKRQILDFELRGRGRSLHLSVVSTPAEQLETQE